jgi:hypothetical protein
MGVQTMRHQQPACVGSEAAAPSGRRKDMSNKKDLDVAADMLRMKVSRRSEVLQVGGDCDGLWIKVKPEADPATFPATCGGHKVHVLRSSLS